jgi:hypothetical protein
MSFLKNIGKAVSSILKTPAEILGLGGGGETQIIDNSINDDSTLIYAGENANPIAQENTSTQSTELSAAISKMLESNMAVIEANKQIDLQERTVANDTFKKILITAGCGVAAFVGYQYFKKGKK